MKSNLLKHCFVLALAGAVLASAKAADERSVSLATLVEETTANNPELNFYRAEVAAAKGELKSAGAWSNPELNVSGGQKRASDARGLQGEGAAWSVSVSQTFEFPGRLSLRKAIANRDLQLAKLGLAQYESALAARARTLGYDLFIAQEKLAATREVAGRFQALAETLVQRDPAGVTPILETRIIEATALTMQREATEAEITAQAALLELNQLRGQPVDAGVRITGAQLDFSNPPALETLLALARANAFELRARQIELEQQGFKISLAKNERFPGVTVAPFISQEKAGDTENIIGLGISLPLPFWNRNAGNIGTAQAREQQAQASLLVTQREIERRVAGAALALQAKQSEMNAWRGNSVEKFREAAALADRHYRLGAVPVTTYIELQKQYLEAAAAMLATQKEALEAAQTLGQLTGQNFFAGTGADKEAK